MVSSSIDDFLGNVIQEAVRTRAYLCLISHLVSPEESNENEGVITPALLMWNHFAAIHNSNRAVDQCALNLSEGNEGDELIASAPNPCCAPSEFHRRKKPSPFHHANGNE